MENVSWRTFYGCSSLTEVTFYEGLTNIAADAFQKCDSIMTITLPKSLTGITATSFNYSIPGFKIRGCAGTTAQRLAAYANVGFEVLEGPVVATETKLQNSEPKVRYDNNSEKAASTHSGKADINGDGIVNISDFSKVAAHIKGRKMLKNTIIADINNDNIINITDLSRIAAFIKGKKML